MPNTASIQADKSHMLLKYEIKEQNHTKYISISGTSFAQTQVHIPAVIDSLPVSAISARAFAAVGGIKLITIPDSVKEVHQFAFQSCEDLKKVELSDSIRYFNDTAFRQCRALEEIEITFKENNKAIISDILASIDNRILIKLIFEDGTAFVLFPDYDYVYSENTMARLFSLDIDGCGMAYHECTGIHGIHFREYDRLFDKAKHEDVKAAPFIALYRLMYPYDISQTAKNRYEEYFRNEYFSAEEKTLPYLIESIINTEKYDMLAFLVKNSLLPVHTAKRAVDYSSENKKTKFNALLMDYIAQAAAQKAQAKTFSL